MLRHTTIFSRKTIRKILLAEAPNWINFIAAYILNGNHLYVFICLNVFNNRFLLWRKKSETRNFYLLYWAEWAWVEGLACADPGLRERGPPSALAEFLSSSIYNSHLLTICSGIISGGMGSLLSWASLNGLPFIKTACYNAMHILYKLLLKEKSSLSFDSDDVCIVLQQVLFKILQKSKL